MVRRFTDFPAGDAIPVNDILLLSDAGFDPSAEIEWSPVWSLRDERFNIFPPACCIIFTRARAAISSAPTRAAAPPATRSRRPSSMASSSWSRAMPVRSGGTTGCGAPRSTSRRWATARSSICARSSRPTAGGCGSSTSPAISQFRASSRSRTGPRRRGSMSRLVPARTSIGGWRRGARSASSTCAWQSTPCAAVVLDRKAGRAAIPFRCVGMLICGRTARRRVGAHRRRRISRASTGASRCWPASRPARRRGLDVLVLDQTRPDLEIPVARVIVPGLRHLDRRFAPGRLYDVPVELGLRKRPLREAELNPLSPPGRGAP